MMVGFSEVNFSRSNTMPAITSELTQKILKDITTSELSSYQIAFKYQVNKMVVDSIGRKNLGDAIYKNDVVTGKENGTFPSRIIQS